MGIQESGCSTATGSALAVVVPLDLRGHDGLQGVDGGASLSNLPPRPPSVRSAARPGGRCFFTSLLWIIPVAPHLLAVLLREALLQALAGGSARLPAAQAEFESLLGLQRLQAQPFDRVALPEP